ncbi:MAG: HAMP domain-containing histidine kinase [Aphanocapsa sp. GSE-SYN-MK-11-07L]|nr:HAMP domain-containing histidine kinase [Aphanocapsa sp. GSE-SYN-MK-11-07L]
MDLLYFLAGLAIGVAILASWRSRVNVRLGQILQGFRVQPFQSSALDRLASVVETQKHINQVLEQQLALWQQIVYTAPIAYLQVDEDNQLTWNNQQAGQLLGIEQHSPTPRRLLLQVIRSYELDRLIEKTRRTQQPVQQDWLHHASAGGKSHQLVPLRGYGFPLPQDQVGVFIEDRREAVTLREERDRWASDVAHELKTPLTSIRLVAETLQSRIDPRLRSWIDRLLNETIRLSLLVQDLLELSRMTFTPNPELEHTPLDLAQLIRSAWLSLEPLSSSKQLSLDYAGFSPLMIAGNEAQLYRVVLNLLDNSIKYSPNQAIVRVQTCYTTGTSVEDAAVKFGAAQYICLEIIDSGPGFSAQALPHIFERFYRADPARARQVVTESALGVGSGSGLGLAIVQQIVATHGGMIRANNHPDTGGAWLQVFLPLPIDQDLGTISSKRSTSSAELAAKPIADPAIQTSTL